MIEKKQGWILAEAEFITERELIEKIKEKKNEQKGDREIKKLLNQEEEDEGFEIYPEDLTPIYRKVRFKLEDVENFKECTTSVKLVEVTFRHSDEFFVLKCTIDQFDKVFFD